MFSYTFISLLLIETVRLLPRHHQLKHPLPVSVRYPLPPTTARVPCTQDGQRSQRRTMPTLPYRMEQLSGKEHTDKGEKSNYRLTSVLEHKRHFGAEGWEGTWTTHHTLPAMSHPADNYAEDGSTMNDDWRATSLSCPQHVSSDAQFEHYPHASITTWHVPCWNTPYTA